MATLTVLDRRSLPSLFSLVFGEGVINDAVSVVLLGAIRGLSDATAAAADGKGEGGRGVTLNQHWQHLSDVQCVATLHCSPQSCS